MDKKDKRAAEGFMKFTQGLFQLMWDIRKEYPEIDELEKELKKEGSLAEEKDIFTGFTFGG